MARKKQTPSILGGTPKEKKVPHKARPFPEIIDEQDWEVREGRYPSYIKRANKEGAAHVMQVPLGETPIDRKIRLHEQAHVTWTPHTTDEEEFWEYINDPETLNATEDARIIELMRRRSDEWKDLNEKEVGLLTPQMQKAFQDGFGKLAAHLRAEKDPEEAKKKKAAPEKVMSLVEAARLIASTRGYAEGKIFDQIAKSADLDWVRRDVEKMHKEFITSQKNLEEPGVDGGFAHSIAYAEHLEEYFWNKQYEIEEANAAMAESGLEEMWGGMGATTPAEPVYTPPTEEKGKTQKLQNDWTFGKTPERREDGGNQWGKLTIVHKPLVDKLAAKEARKIRPNDVGAVPRYMHRLLTDQRIFGRRRKKKEFEGTVLIDCSGSMHLTPAMIDEILRRWPAVTIGTYNGRGKEGELWIVANKGKRAKQEDLKPPYGGNVVDGPALDWLAREKHPRVWISDGGVTGASNSGSESAANCFVVDAAKKMKRGRIKRLANVQALLGGDGDEDYYY